MRYLRPLKYYFLQTLKPDIQVDGSTSYNSDGKSAHDIIVMKSVSDIKSELMIMNVEFIKAICQHVSVQIII